MARRIALTAILLAAGCTSSEAPPPQPSTTAPPPTPPATEATTTTTPPPPAPTATTGPLPVVARRPAPQPAPPPQTATSSSAPTPEPAAVPSGAAVSGAGKASWYARGTTTASGERFDPDGLSAAHRTLAFGTRLRVCRPAGEPCVVVRITDRGPAEWTGREIDLSRGAFAAIAPLGAGVVDVVWMEAA